MAAALTRWGRFSPSAAGAPRWLSSADSGGVRRTKTRVIGILGGMSPSSTELYYNRLDTLVRAELGGLHSADCLIRSVLFHPPMLALRVTARSDSCSVCPIDLELLRAMLRALVRPHVQPLLLHVPATCHDDLA